MNHRSAGTDPVAAASPWKKRRRRVRYTFFPGSGMPLNLFRFDGPAGSLNRTRANLTWGSPGQQRSRIRAGSTTERNDP